MTETEKYFEQTVLKFRAWKNLIIERCPFKTGAGNKNYSCLCSWPLRTADWKVKKIPGDLRLSFGIVDFANVSLLNVWGDNSLVLFSHRRLLYQVLLGVSKATVGHFIIVLQGWTICLPRHGDLKEQCPGVWTENFYKWRKWSLNLWENDFKNSS